MLRHVSKKALACGFGVFLAIPSGAFGQQNRPPEWNTNPSAINRTASPQNSPQPVFSPAQSATNQSPSNQSRLEVYEFPREMVGTIAARLQIQYAKDPNVRITTEPGSGKLMVLALPAVHQEVARTLETLRQEIQRSAPNGVVATHSSIQRTYKLRNITWREMEDALQRMIGPRLTVSTMGNGEVAQFRLMVGDRPTDILQIDRRRDEISLQGTSNSIHGWLQVVAAIDNGRASADFPTRIVTMTPADPSKIERALRLVRATLQDPIQDPEELESQILDLNQQQDPQATGIAGVLGMDAESGLFGDVQIEFIPELNIVIVKGNKRDVQRVIDLIEQIKKQSVETKPEIEIVTLANVESRALATILQQLNEQVLSARQGQVSITPLGQPNALLLIGRLESVNAMKELIEKLDQPLDPLSSLRVFKLKFASAVDAEQTVTTFFSTVVGATQGTTQTPGLDVRVRVVSDFRTNSLIVQASPRDMGEVARLIEDIDVESTAAENEIRVFTLKNALASELQPIIQSALTGQAAAQQGQQGQQGQFPGGQGAAASTTNRSTPLSSRLRIIESGKQTESGILSGVVVTANPAINALVVRAPSKSMELIKALIEQLDQSPSAEAQIKVFQVANGSATALATTLQQIFGAQATTGAGAGGGLFGLQNLATNLGGANQDGSIVPIRIAVDVRTNSIIASGSKSVMEVMEVLLLRLDEEGLLNKTIEVFWLRNNQAATVATAITNFYNQQRQIQIQQTVLNQNLNPYEQLEQNVIAVPEEQTNSVVISAAPRYVKQIRDMIERLDRRPPLIVVEVLLAEVTLDDNFEFGMEWGLQDSLLFDRGLASAGNLSSPGFNLGNAPINTSPNNPNPKVVAPQGLSTFGLGRTNPALGYGGLVLSASSNSVGALFRTLQDANRLQILSRPQVMTVDNAEGFVQIGARVPRVSNVTAGNINAGPTISTQDVDVGLILRIQPRTNKDGLILMNVAIERSSVGAPETGIPVGFGPNGEVIRSPIINITQAQTRVSAYNNQTVVFAGLITKQRLSRSRRIPLLADIPVVGNLFKFDSESETRTELLVVMTPRIITNPDEMEIHNDVESARMSWCLADILNIHGDASLQAGNGLWGPAASPVIYPDIDPAVSFDDYGRPNTMMIGDPRYGYPGMAPSSIEGTDMQGSLIVPGEPGAVGIAPPVSPMGYETRVGGGSGVVPAGIYDPQAVPNQGTPLQAIQLTPSGANYIGNR